MFSTFSAAKRSTILRNFIVVVAIAGVTVVVFEIVRRKTGSAVDLAYAIALIAAFVLPLAAFTKGARIFPRWIRISLWLVSPILLGWGSMGFLLRFARTRLSPNEYYSLYYLKPTFGGMALGILLLLILSGELFPRSNIAKKTGTRGTDDQGSDR